MAAAFSVGQLYSLCTGHSNPLRSVLPFRHKESLLHLRSHFSAELGTQRKEKEKEKEKEKIISKKEITSWSGGILLVSMAEKLGRRLKDTLSPKQKGDWKDVLLMSLSFAVYVYVSQKIVCAYCAWVSMINHSSYIN